MNVNLLFYYNWVTANNRLIITDKSIFCCFVFGWFYCQYFLIKVIGNILISVHFALYYYMSFLFKKITKQFPEIHKNTVIFKAKGIYPSSSFHLYFQLFVLRCSAVHVCMIITLNACFPTELKNYKVGYPIFDAVVASWKNAWENIYVLLTSKSSLDTLTKIQCVGKQKVIS